MGNQVKYRHPEMAAVMEAARERMASFGTFRHASPKQQSAIHCRFARHLADRHPRDVTWEEICEVGWREKSAAGAALVFAFTLLDGGLLESSLEEALRSWRPYVERALGQEGRMRILLPLYLCGSCVEWLAADPATAEFATAMFSTGLRDSIAKRRAGALNPEMVSLLREVAEVYYAGEELRDVSEPTLAPFKRFFTSYAFRRPQDISWEEECAGKEACERRLYLLTLFTVLLDRGLYAQDHKEALLGLNESFKAVISGRRSCNTGSLLCGEDIEYLCAMPSNIAEGPRNHKQLFMVIRTRNAYLRGVLARFLQGEKIANLSPTAEKVDVLLRSMGDSADGISRLGDFTASLFWKQAQFIRDEFAAGTCQRVRYAGFLRGFYLYLSELDPERDLFANATSLSYELVHSRALTDYIAQDYLVTSFHPGMALGDAERVALIVRGFDDLSTYILSEDWVQMDISSLRCSFYRQELLAFACRSSRGLITAASTQAAYICQALQALFEAKGRSGYPNPSLEAISRAEVAFIRKGVERSGLSVSTRSGILTSIRAFFQWERDARKRISFEEFAIDNLRGLSRERRQSDARAAPQEHLAQLSALLAERSREGLEWALSNALLHLLLQTEIRAGQICHLDVGCIRPTAKPNEHVISSTSKTSRGEREEFVVTQRTLDVLNGAIDATEDVRRRFAKRSTSRYIFIYQDEHGRLRRMSVKRFNKKLAECCAELGIEPAYTTGNLRDTHETLAVRFSTDEEGEIRPSAALLSGHAGIATTVERYVDVGIEEMIAATFDVYIGDNLQVDADGKVVEVIPEEARGEDRVVEGGCGCCTAQYCSVTSPLPCLVCESFVTTIDHEPFFVRAMEAVGSQLQHAASRHDAEDLTAIKRLLAAYLAAIYRRKREREQRNHG